MSAVVGLRPTPIMVMLLLLVASAVCLPSHIYFVNSMTGKANNTGHSPSSPLQTIQQAVDASRATSDDSCTILLGGGPYTGPGNIGIALPDKPTKLNAYHDLHTGAYATIDCQNTRITAFFVSQNFSIFSSHDLSVEFVNCGTAINATNAPRVELEGASFNNCGTGVLSYNTGYFVARRLFLWDQNPGTAAIIMKSLSSGSSASLWFSHLDGATVLFQGYDEVTIRNVNFRNVENATALVLKQCQQVIALALTMINCTSSGDGGAIYAEDAPLSMVYGQFYLCSAGNNGGAIYTDSFLEMGSSRFLDCSAGDSGGCLYANSPYETELFMELTHFGGCYAPNGAGGGVDLEGSYKKIVFADALFTNNTASVGGGFACCAHTNGACGIGQVVLIPGDYFNDNTPDDYSCGPVVFSD